MLRSAANCLRLMGPVALDFGRGDGEEDYLLYQGRGKMMLRKGQWLASGDMLGQSPLELAL